MAVARLYRAILGGLNLAVLLFFIVLWYLVGVGLFVSWGYELKSLFWVFLFNRWEWSLYSGLSGPLMAFLGYLVRWWELQDRGEKLARKERELREWERYLRGERRAVELEREEVKKLEERRKELEESVESLEEEVRRGYEKLLALKRRLAELGEEEARVMRAEEEGFRRGYEEGYEAVITELRSLRAQKSAVLDLFDEIPELDQIVIQKKGVNLRRYLEVEKRRRLYGGD